MIKEIKYKGLSTTPSDYECEDGHLAAAENIIFNSGGDIQTPQQPSQVKNFGSYEPLYIHRPNNTRTHYICCIQSGNDKLLKYVEANSNTFNDIADLGNVIINNITSIGLILIVTTNEGVIYYSWKDFDDTQSYTEVNLNDIDLKFGFAFSMNGVQQVTAYANLGLSGTPTTINNIDEDKKNTLRGVMNTVLEKTEKGNLFHSPFLIRYAIRMYDGNIMYLSSPALMLPQTGPSAYAYRHDVYDGSGSKVGDMLVGTYSSRLQIAKFSSNIIQYKDLIKDIVIAMTPMVRNNMIDADGRFVIADSLVRRGNESTGATASTIPPCYDYYSTAYRTFTRDQGQPSISAYAKHTPILQIITGQDQDLIACAQPYPMTEEEFYDKIISSSNFYIIKSFSVDEVTSLTSSYQNLALDGFPLATLTAQRTIDDNVYCLSKFKDINVSFTYNGRLNIANYSQSIFNGYYPQLMNNRCDGYFSYSDFHSNSDVLYKTIIDVAPDGSSYSMRLGSSGSSVNPIYTKSPFQFFYYPNTNARHLTIYRRRTVVDGEEVSYEYKKFSVNLEKSRLLNGSFFSLSDFSNNSNQDVVWENLSESDPLWNDINDNSVSVQYQNRIIASYVNNPFVFSVENAAIVSSDRIIAAATSAKELSQGQFGQYPIYLFTNDGVWATDISDDGTIVKIVPISKDVIKGDGNSIMAIESSVIFASDKGIMEISGSQTRCLSNVLDNDNNIIIKNSPNIISAISNIKGTPYNVAISFREYIGNCRMFSDYINNRIIIYNPAYGYCFTYDILNKAFSIVNQKFYRNINAYPNSHVIVRNANNTFKIVDVKDMTPIVVASYMNETNGWFLTRPISLGDPNMQKVIDYVKQNGVFDGYIEKTAAEMSSIPTSLTLYAWVLHSEEDEYIYTKSATPSQGDFVYDDNVVPDKYYKVSSYTSGEIPEIEIADEDESSVLVYERDSSHDITKQMNDTAAYAKQFGAFVSDSIQQVLFGSNDLVNWVVISSSRSHRISDYSGSPYKWFRLAVKCSFKPGESLSSVTFSFRNKFSNDKLL